MNALGRFVVTRIDGARIAIVALVFAGRAHTLLAEVALRAGVAIVACAARQAVFAAGDCVARVRRAGVFVIAGRQIARTGRRRIALIIVGARIAIVASEADRWFEHARSLNVARVDRARVAIVARQLPGLACFLGACVADRAGIGVVTRDAVG